MKQNRNEKKRIKIKKIERLDERNKPIYSTIAFFRCFKNCYCSSKEKIQKRKKEKMQSETAEIEVSSCDQ